MTMAAIPEIDKTLNKFQRIEQALQYKELLAAQTEYGGEILSKRIADLAGASPGEVGQVRTILKRASDAERMQLRQGAVSIGKIWEQYKTEREKPEPAPRHGAKRRRIIKVRKHARVAVSDDDGLPLTLTPVSEALDPKRHAFQQQAKAEVRRRIAAVQGKSLTLRDMADRWPEITTQVDGGRHRPERARMYLREIAQVPGVAVVQDGDRYTVRVEDANISKQLYAGLGGKSVAEYLAGLSAEITRRRKEARDKYHGWRPDNIHTGQQSALLDYLEDELTALKKLL